jgi:hypothetical protein
VSHAYTENQLVEQPAIRSVADLLTAVKPALSAADREWQRATVNEAPNFRAISLVGPDENCLSDIIAELLNPHGSHGQGETFLNLFSSRCGSIGKLTKNHASIHRESRTIFIANQKRRMDILIDGGRWGIAIENKPWAGEQKDQLQDYAENFEKHFGENFMLIRLTGRDAEVTSMGTARRGQLLAQGRSVSWLYATDLLAWAHECCQSCYAPRVTGFLDEFSRYIIVEFMATTNPRRDIERKCLLPALETILTKEPDKLESIAAIADAFPDYDTSSSDSFSMKFRGKCSGCCRRVGVRSMTNAISLKLTGRALVLRTQIGTHSIG